LSGKVFNLRTSFAKPGNKGSLTSNLGIYFVVIDASP
jgi:hypothetical protein